MLAHATVDKLSALQYATPGESRPSASCNASDGGEPPTGPSVTHWVGAGPAGAPSPQPRLARRAIEGEDPLLAVPVIEVSDVEVGGLGAEGRRDSARRGMVIVNRQPAPTRGAHLPPLLAGARAATASAEADPGWRRAPAGSRPTRRDQSRPHGGRRARHRSGFAGARRGDAAGSSARAWRIATPGEAPGAGPASRGSRRFTTERRGERMTKRFGRARSPTRSDAPRRTVSRDARSLPSRARARMNTADRDRIREEPGGCAVAFVKFVKAMLGLLSPDVL
jgi:hypothetical protein